MVRNPAGIKVGRERLQEECGPDTQDVAQDAAIDVSGRGAKSLSPST